MKKFVVLVAAVLGLGAASVLEAQAGRVVVRVGRVVHRRVVIRRGGHVRVHYGIHRTVWAHRVWNRTYNRYFYSDPAVRGFYYWSATNNVYYPITVLEAPAASVQFVDGIQRTTWATRTWNTTYNRYFYSDPTVQGYYFWSETDNAYYPITLSEVPQGSVQIVTPR